MDSVMKFINADHEKAYNDAKRMLDDEIERQGKEAKRLLTDVERLPKAEQARRITWMQQHFAARREPYVNLLVEIVSLTTATMMVEAPQPS